MLTGDDFEAQRLAVLEYANLEDVGDDEAATEAKLVQTHTIGGRTHNAWLVTTSRGARIWVIDGGSSFDGERFNVWDAIYMHIGQTMVLAERSGRPCPYSWPPRT